MKILKAVLGWSNPGTGGDNSQRLYALDKGGNPRWDRGGRTVERALLERGEAFEGDRYLLVRVGDRFVKEETVSELATKIELLLELEEYKAQMARILLREGKKDG